MDMVKRSLTSDSEDEDGDDSESIGRTSSPIAPEVVISLEASDDFLRNRVINLPESKVEGTHNTEEGLLRRLAEYKENNNEEDSVLAYFDQREDYPDKIDITKDESDMMKDTVAKIMKIIGEPRNYGPTAEELEEIRHKEELERVEKEEREREEKARLEAEHLEVMRLKQHEWNTRLEDIRREEIELLNTKSEPLRNYLMRHVMPTLTQALIDCCKTRPDDPVDYLAEYIFQNNPQMD